MIASGVPGTDHQPVFHDLLCVQRQPHARSFLLNNEINLKLALQHVNVMCNFIGPFIVLAISR